MSHFNFIVKKDRLTRMYFKQITIKNEMKRFDKNVFLKNILLRLA